MVRRPSKSDKSPLSKAARISGITLRNDYDLRYGIIALHGQQHVNFFPSMRSGGRGGRRTRSGEEPPKIKRSAKNAPLTAILFLLP